MDKYTSYPVEKIYPEKNIPGTLYFYINGKFIKYLHAEDALSKDKYDYLVERKFKYLFVESVDYEKFYNWSRKKTEEREVNFELLLGKGTAKIAKRQVALEDNYISFATREVTDQTTKALLDKTNAFIKTIMETQAAQGYFKQLAKFEKRTAHHSLNVANLSAFLAINLGYKSDTELEHIYMGALLHDYGKIKLPKREVGAKDPNKYKAVMRKHALGGKTSLILEGILDEEAIRIVGEHHERYDGKGYPQGLRGAQISPYTKIVSIANAFDKLIEKNKDDKDLAQRTAIKTLQKDHSRHFDPKILARCIRAMNQVMK